VRFRERNSVSSLAHLYQRGCGRVRFPAVENPDYPEAVLINTAGGLTGGDHMAFDISLEAGARLTVSGQAAERIYRSIGTTAIIEAEMTVADGATLEWLPQETILFDQSRFKRINTVYLEKGSRFLALEATLFGRTAHGETICSASIRDGWRIHHDGALIWYDNFMLEGDIQAKTRHPALLDGARGMATVLLVDDMAELYLETARAAARNCGVRAAVTCRGCLLIMRLIATNGYDLRKALVGILIELRRALPGHPAMLPKVWENM
jgi:urease accessory protein|tara:strand:- start:57492 stop:58286 length:795 start_codon:yes stop_codon:yes gene_type:complete